MELISWVLFLGLLWACIKFYWLGFIVLATIFAGWTAIALVAPLALAITDLLGGEILSAAMTLLVGGVLTSIWWIGAKAALKRCRKSLKDGTLIRKWNETNF